MYAKFEKCEFLKKEIQYLGHVISEKGIVGDPQKLKEILECLVPKDVTEIRSVMGLIGYTGGSSTDSQI